MGVRWLLNKELALSYNQEENLTHYQAEELLSAVFAVNSLSNIDYNDKKWTLLEIEELLQKHTDVFTQLFKSSNRDSILNKLIGIITGYKIEKQWKEDPTYPYFKTLDEEYQIDFSKGTTNIESIDSLPKDIAMHPDVLKIFNQNPPNACTKSEKNGFLVIFEKKSFRIFQGKNEVIIQRKFEMQGKKVWGQYIKSNKEIEAIFPSSFCKTYTFWVCNSPRSLIMTDKQHQLVARADHHQVFQINNNGLDTGLVLDLTERLSLTKILSTFEDKRYFNIWVDEGTRYPQQIDFPRLGLSGVTFKLQKINGKDRLVSDTFPEFFLSEKQFIKNFQNDLSYLLLENSSGEQHAVIAKQFFKVSLDSQRIHREVLDTSKDYLEKKLNTLHLSQQSFFQYKVNPITGKLESPSLAARMYLSLRFLSKMRYEEAEELLRSHDAFIRSYTNEEIEILENIADMHSFNGDQDPRATAISLYAVYLLEKNSRDFEKSDISKPEIDSNFKPNFSYLYSTYLNQINNIYEVRLTSEEELLLLHAIPLKNEAMVNRLIELDPVKGRLMQAQFSQGDKNNTTLSTVPRLADVHEIVNVFEEAFKEVYELSKSFDKGFISKIRDKDYQRLTISPQDFKKLYELIRTKDPIEKQKKDFQDFIGLSFPEKNFNWREELAAVLRVITRSDAKLSTLAWILLALLEHPNTFTLDLDINRFKSFIRFKNFYENELLPKLHQLYPQITQPKNLFANLKSKKRASKIAPSSTVNQNFQYQHSLAMKIPLLTSPIIPPLEDIVTVNSSNDTIKTADLIPLKQTFSSLSTKDPVVKQEMTRITDSIDRYKNSMKNREEQLCLTSLENLNDYANTLSNILVEEQSALRDQEMDLLSSVNRLPEDSLLRAKSEILNVGQSRQLLTIDDLIYLYWNRDAALFHEANPNLSVEEIQALGSRIQQMLIQATYLQQLKRILKQIRSIQENPESEELSEQLKLFKSFVEATHAYDINIHPEYLVLEYYADILLRPEQIKNLDLLQIRNGKINDRQNLGSALEMIMGGGKTTVLLPLLGILNADGDTLSIGVIPNALLPSMSTMLAERLGTSFKKTIEVVSIDRETPIDEAFLARLQSIRKGKKVILMTDSSLQSLFLNFIEHLNTFSQASKEQRLSLESEQRIFKEIFTLLKEHSSVIIDEVDQILNPRTEKHYTLGDASPLPVHEIELIATFYEILESDSEITKHMRFEFSPEAEDTLIKDLKARKIFLTKTYELQVKPKLVEAIIQKKVGTKNLEVLDYFDHLDQKETQLIKDYLATQSPESVAYVCKQKLIIKDILALAKEAIQSLLPLTCVKLSHQDYGLKENIDYAIPFHGSDTPSLKSQFGTPYETLDYTFQILIKKGINHEVISREIKALRDSALQEFKEGKVKTIEETQANQKFIELVDDSTLKLFGSDQMLNKIAAKINSKLTLKLHFIQNYIAPQIKNHRKTISANPQMYNFLFSSLNAFTGTQWNADSFPERLNIIPDEIITGKTLALLWENRQEPIYVVKSYSAKNVVFELIANNPQAITANALIDTAGMIRDIERIEVAKQQLNALKDRKDIKGIVFYDVNNELVILEQGKNDPIPLSNSKLQPHERFTFYDQKHTTGADIKQKPNAMSIVTIGKNTLLRDLLQSVWRLRGLDKSQKVQFTIDEEVRDLIANELKEIGVSVKLPIKLEYLLLFTAYNQAKLQGDNNFRSFKHKTWEVMQQEVFKTFLDSSLDSDQMATLFNLVSSLFVQESVDSPWKLFGEPTVLIDSDLAVKNQVEKVKSSPAFETLTTTSSMALRAELDLLISKMTPLLPNKIASSQATYGREIEVEAEKEKQQEKEMQIETETEFSDKKYKPHLSYYGTVTMTEAFTATKGLESFADIFDEGFLGSGNFFPLERVIKEKSNPADHPPFGIFNQYQKPICGLWLKSENEIIMVDQYDATTMPEIILYDLNLGLYQFSGKVPEYLENEKFLYKVVQAKFFNGETYYKPEEIQLLRNWIEEKGTERMRKLFVGHILKFKEESRSAFPNSILDQIL